MDSHVVIQQSSLFCNCFASNLRAGKWRREPRFGKHEPAWHEWYHSLTENRCESAPALYFMECVRRAETYTPPPSLSHQRICPWTAVIADHRDRYLCLFASFTIKKTQLFSSLGLCSHVKLVLYKVERTVQDWLLWRDLRLMSFFLTVDVLSLRWSHT